MFTDLQAVLFDLDGTLIDSAPDLGAAADQMRVDRGLASYPLERYRFMAGAGARGMLGIAFDVTPDDPRYQSLCEEFFRNYESRLTQLTKPFDGVTGLIEALQAHHLPWGIVTNKVERFALPVVEHFPWAQTAGTVIGGDTTPHPKPHPAPLFEAARRLGVAPDHCLYVGDDLRDIKAGRAAGMSTVAAAWGYLGDKGHITTWQADKVAETPSALLKLINWA